MPLISFEGIDGSGKSTQIELLATWLKSKNYAFTVVREPGGTELSEKIRSLLLDTNLSIHPTSELMLFSAARAQLVEEVIQKNLNENTWVILDRFFDSTTAYQGYGREVASIKQIKALNMLATGGLEPDCTFLLDLEVDTAFNRNMHKPKDRMENAGEEFFKRVVNAYRTLAAEVERIHTIDASRNPERIHDEIIQKLKEKFPALH